jgi:hypothetical protein
MIVPIESEAKISPDGLYRFTLRRVWLRPPECIGGSVMYIGHNPSTADAQVNDPTIRRMMDFAARWGYGRMSVVNLLPFRSPNPVAAHDWYNQKWPMEDWFTGRGAAGAFLNNAKTIAVEAEDAKLVVACWGAIAKDIGNLSDDIRMFCANTGIDLRVFGLTKEGFPVHPMARGIHRVPDDVKLQHWI